MRGQKGITLVALIITIIVLLILAVVAIASVSDDGIFNYARNGANTYEQAQDNELNFINWAADYIDNEINK